MGLVYRRSHCGCLLPLLLLLILYLLLLMHRLLMQEVFAGSVLHFHWRPRRRQAGHRAARGVCLRGSQETAPASAFLGNRI